jgi:hypothetical protein
MSNESNRTVFVLLCRHWVGMPNKPGDKSFWGRDNELAKADEQTRCIATAAMHLDDYDIIHWGASPLVRARKTAAWAANIYGGVSPAPHILTYPGLAASDFAKEEVIYANLKARGVRLDTAREIWLGMILHSDDAASVARTSAEAGYETVLSVARKLKAGTAAALYTHHPLLPWIVARATGNFEDMVYVEKGGIVEMRLRVTGEQVVFEAATLLPMAGFASRL